MLKFQITSLLNQRSTGLRLQGHPKIVTFVVGGIFHYSYNINHMGTVSQIDAFLSNARTNTPSLAKKSTQKRSIKSTCWQKTPSLHTSNVRPRPIPVYKPSSNLQYGQLPSSHILWTFVNGYTGTIMLPTSVRHTPIHRPTSTDLSRPHHRSPSLKGVGLATCTPRETALSSEILQDVEFLGNFVSTDRSTDGCRRLRHH